MESTIINGGWEGHLGKGLAPRELQFLLSVAQGMRTKEIAREFGTQRGNVVKRLSNAMFKLGVTRQPAMVAEAIRRKIITPVCIALAPAMAIHSGQLVSGHRTGGPIQPGENEEGVFLA